MYRNSKAAFSTLIALALFSLIAAGCVLDDELGDDAAAEEGVELGEEAAVVPRHAVVTCDSASFYRNYDSSSGPVHLIRTLGRDNESATRRARTRPQRLGRHPRFRPRRLGLHAHRVHRRLSSW